MNSFKSHESESNKNFIKDIPLFSQKNIDSIKAFCEICVFAKGDMILKDGDEPDHFYMIKQGRVKVEKWVKVQKKNYWPVSTSEWEASIVEQNIIKHVLTLNTGQYFGETEMIKNEPMSVRLLAYENPTILITIEWKWFFEIFPVLEWDSVLSNSHNVKYPNEE